MMDSSIRGGISNNISSTNGEIVGDDILLLHARARSSFLPPLSSSLTNSNNKRCFVGHEAVSWLIDNWPGVCTREDGIHVGQSLLSYGAFVPNSGGGGGSVFRDDDTIYRWSHDDIGTSPATLSFEMQLARETFVQYPQDKLVDVSQQLRHSIMEGYDGHHDCISGDDVLVSLMKQQNVSRSRARKLANQMLSFGLITQNPEHANHPSSLDKSFQDGRENTYTIELPVPFVMPASSSVAIPRELNYHHFPNYQLARNGYLVSVYKNINSLSSSSSSSSFTNLSLSPNNINNNNNSNNVSTNVSYIMLARLSDENNILQIGMSLPISGWTVRYPIIITLHAPSHIHVYNIENESSQIAPLPIQMTISSSNSITNMVATVEQCLLADDRWISVNTPEKIILWDRSAHIHAPPFVADLKDNHACIKSINQERSRLVASTASKVTLFLVNAQSDGDLFQIWEVNIESREVRLTCRGTLPAQTMTSSAASAAAGSSGASPTYRLLTCACYRETVVVTTTAHHVLLYDRTTGRVPTPTLINSNNNNSSSSSSSSLSSHIVSAVFLDDWFLVTGSVSGIVSLYNRRDGSFVANLNVPTILDYNVFHSNNDSNGDGDQHHATSRDLPSKSGQTVTSLSTSEKAVVSSRVNNLNRIGRWVFCSFECGRLSVYDIYRSEATFPIKQYTHPKMASVRDFLVQAGHVVMLVGSSGEENGTVSSQATVPSSPSRTGGAFVPAGISSSPPSSPSRPGVGGAMIIGQQKKTPSGTSLSPSRPALPTSASHASFSPSSSSAIVSGGTSPSSASASAFSPRIAASAMTRAASSLIGGQSAVSQLQINVRQVQSADAFADYVTPPLNPSVVWSPKLDGLDVFLRNPALSAHTHPLLLTLIYAYRRIVDVLDKFNNAGYDVFELIATMELMRNLVDVIIRTQSSMAKNQPSELVPKEQAAEGLGVVGGVPVLLLTKLQLHIDDLHSLISRLNSQNLLPRFFSSSRLRSLLETSLSGLHSFIVSLRGHLPPSAISLLSSSTASSSDALSSSSSSSSPAAITPWSSTFKDAALIEDPDGRALWLLEYGAENVLVEWNVFFPRFWTFLSSAKRGIPEKANTLKNDIERMLAYLLDQSGTGFVGQKRFSDLLKGFGPIDQCLETLCSIVEPVWFHGLLSRQESDLLLASEPPGTYLVRLSRSSSLSFALAVRHSDGKVHHILIDRPISSTAPMTMLAQNSNNQQQQQKRRCYRVIETIGQSVAEFNTLQELIAHYPRALISPKSSSLTAMPWYAGDVTREETEEILGNHTSGGSFLIRHAHIGRDDGSNMEDGDLQRKNIPGNNSAGVEHNPAALQDFLSRTFVCSFMRSDFAVQHVIISKEDGQYRWGADRATYPSLQQLIQNNPIIRNMKPLPLPAKLRPPSKLGISGLLTPRPPPPRDVVIGSAPHKLAASGMALKPSRSLPEHSTPTSLRSSPSPGTSLSTTALTSSSNNNDKATTTTTEASSRHPFVVAPPLKSPSLNSIVGSSLSSSMPANLVSSPSLPSASLASSHHHQHHPITSSPSMDQLLIMSAGDSFRRPTLFSSPFPFSSPSSQSPIKNAPSSSSATAEISLMSSMRPLNLTSSEPLSYPFKPHLSASSSTSSSSSSSSLSNSDPSVYPSLNGAAGSTKELVDRSQIVNVTLHDAVADHANEVANLVAKILILVSNVRLVITRSTFQVLDTAQLMLIGQICLYVHRQLKSPHPLGPFRLPETGPVPATPTTMAVRQLDTDLTILTITLNYIDKSLRDISSSSSSSSSLSLPPSVPLLGRGDDILFKLDCITEALNMADINASRTPQPPSARRFVMGVKAAK
eukprot:TRINITY_DN2820_c0_g1_i4.p1 TRINITY_DN2820_c0_g1~~TRINITY_DN2820_c0_g1_i4.p1  ORF type:complete len:1830 (+),score=320.96 TRINITY_DN2820_c0_g1_i4:3-5492(+)